MSFGVSSFLFCFGCKESYWRVFGIMVYSVCCSPKLGPIRCLEMVSVSSLCCLKLAMVNKSLVVVKHNIISNRIVLEDIDGNFTLHQLLLSVL